MARQPSLLTMIQRAGEGLEQARDGGRAAIAAVRSEASGLGRQVGAQAVRTALQLARDPRLPPGLQRQMLTVAALAAPKRGGAPAVKPVRRPRTTPPSTSVRQAGSGVREALVEAGMQADAFMRGAADVLTFTKADEIAAGLNAAGATAISKVTPGKGDDQPFSQRYEAELAAQQGRDAFDKTYRPAARTGGQVAGAALGLAASNLGNGAALVRMLPKGARIVRNAQSVKRLGLDMRGMTRLSAVGGGAVGGATQLATDISRGELSDIRDYAGSTLTGIAGGVAGRFGGLKAAGAVAGGLTPVMQSLASGEAASASDVIDRAAHGAFSGAVTGRAAGAVGKYGSSALPSKLKGDLGEGFSYLKSIARDGKPPTTQVPIRVGKHETIADQVLRDGKTLLEAKFGRWARLSRAQRAAWRAYGPDYLIDHYLPEDVGRVLGVGAAAAAGRIAGEPDPRIREAPRSPPTAAPHATPRAPQ